MATLLQNWLISTCLFALGALELAPEVLDLPVEEEGARAVEHLLAVRARRPLGHVAGLSPVLGGRWPGGCIILFLLLKHLVDDGIKRSFSEY